MGPKGPSHLARTAVDTMAASCRPASRPRATSLWMVPAREAEPATQAGRAYLAEVNLRRR